LLACFYYRLIKSREATKEEKAAKYNIIGKFEKSHALGSLLSFLATALILTNLMIAWPANCDPAGVSKTLNQWYYGIARISFQLGFMLLIMAIFLGHLPKTKALLSGSNLRLMSRSIIIGCVLEVVVIELLFCGDALPVGLYITLPIALILGVGFHFVTPAFAILLMYGIEFPLTRVI